MAAVLGGKAGVTAGMATHTGKHFIGSACTLPPMSCHKAQLEATTTTEDQTQIKNSIWMVWLSLDCNNPVKHWKPSPTRKKWFGGHDYQLIIIILETLGNQAQIENSTWMAWFSIDYNNPGNIGNQPTLKIRFGGYHRGGWLLWSVELSTELNDRWMINNQWIMALHIPDSVHISPEERPATQAVKGSSIQEQLKKSGSTWA